MSVEFEEQDQLPSSPKGYKSREILGELKTPAMVNWLLKSKVAANEETASKILTILTCICFLIAILITLSTLGITTPLSRWIKINQPQPVPAELNQHAKVRQ